MADTEPTQHADTIGYLQPMEGNKVAVVTEDGISVADLPPMTRIEELADRPDRIDGPVCPDCGGPGVTWEDGYVLCDACARKRAVAAKAEHIDGCQGSAKPDQSDGHE